MAVQIVLMDRALAYGDMSTLIGARLYPQRLPQDPTYPAVVQTRISGAPWHGMTADHGITEARFQYDVYAESYADAVAVVEELKGAFARWDDEGADPPILDTWVDNELDLDADEADSAETDIYRITLDVMVLHRS